MSLLEVLLALALVHTPENAFEAFDTEKAKFRARADAQQTREPIPWFLPPDRFRTLFALRFLGYNMWLQTADLGGQRDKPDKHEDMLRGRRRRAMPPTRPHTRRSLPSTYWL